VNNVITPAASADKPEKPSTDKPIIITLITLAVVITAGSWLAVMALTHREKPVGVVVENQRHLVGFSLTDRTGRTVTREDMNGKYLVVDFLFTSCGLTCPVVNRHMAELQKLIAGQPDVLLVSLTVDPRDDTVPVLEKYGEKFGAESNRWFMLTGEKATLYHLINTSFLQQGEPDPFNYMPGNFVHTERIALVDPQGRVRSYFDGLQDDVAQKIAEEISRLRKD
jgi:protein SCO1/2